MTNPSTTSIASSSAPTPLPKTFFHGASVLLEIGSVILPGNYGRMIKTAYPVAPNGSPMQPYREAIFEYARLALAPQKPSRLNSVFVCDSLPEAVAFRNAAQPNNVIYEVEALGDISDSHVADYTTVDVPTSGQYFEVFNLARKYWLGPIVNGKERLLSCPVKIVGIP